MANDQPMQESEIRRYLPHALLATTWVLAMPIAVVTLVTRMMEPAPSRLASATFGVLLSVLATVAGTAVWIRRPGSGVVSFGDLMIWGWVRRRQAEKKLVDASRVLGFDRKGRPLGQAILSTEEQLKLLHELNDALEAKDPYTHGHSRRVERYSYRMGMHLGLPAKQLDDLRLAAALHDVGKVAVPDAILRKPAKLDPDEVAVMNEHPVVGEGMVAHIGNPDIVTAVRHHHESFAGAGYPDRIAGTDIPMFARIIAVADSYDAMTSTRPYRAGMPRKKAVAIVTEESGEQFDPEVVEAFLAQHSVPVPIPAGLAHLFELPRELIANAAVLLRQMGASALASAAGVAGVSVVAAAGLVGGAASEAPVTHRLKTVAAAPAPGSLAPFSFDTEAAQPRARQRSRPTMTAPASREAARLVAAARAPKVGDEVLGIRLERAKNPAKPNGSGPAKPGKPTPPAPPGPPTPLPPVEPPVGQPPVVTPPVVDPPPAGNPPAGNPSAGDPPAGNPPVNPPPVDTGPPPGGGTMPPPGPPLTRPPHQPGTDPQPDRGQECSGTHAGGPGAPHCP